jgi:hypothetical protein
MSVAYAHTDKSVRSDRASFDFAQDEEDWVLASSTAGLRMQVIDNP